MTNKTLKPHFRLLSESIPIAKGISGNGATMAPFVDFAHITIRVLLHAEQTLHDDTWATSSGVDASATPIRICVQNKGVELETDSNV